MNLWNLAKKLVPANATKNIYFI